LTCLFLQAIIGLAAAGHNVTHGNTAVAKGKLTPRKRRTREHVIADLSVNYVERQVLLCGFTVERRWHDYGFDLFLNTYDQNGEVESGEVHFQLKATDRLRVTSDGQTVLFRVERVDLRTWLDVIMPMIFVVFDARAEVAYWLYVQEHFAKHPRRGVRRGSGTITLRIPREQQLDRTAVFAFARFRDKIQQQLTGVRHDD
jgi:hypothetical protein